MWQPAETSPGLRLLAMVRIAAACAAVYILSMPVTAADSGLLNANLGRWIDNEGGLNNLRTYYRRQRRAIPADIVAWIDAGGFAS